MIALAFSGAAHCQSVSGVVQDVNGKTVRNAEVFIERTGNDNVRLSTNSVGEYSSPVAPVTVVNTRWGTTTSGGEPFTTAAGGVQVRITVTGRGFQPAVIAAAVPEGTPSCKADVTLFKKGQQKAGSNAGVLACTNPPPPAPYATMLTFRFGLGVTGPAFMDLQPGLTMQMNKIMSGGASYSSIFINGNYALQVTPPTRQPVWIDVPDAPGMASWTLSNPDVAVLTKVNPIEGRIEFAQDGDAELTLLAPDAANGGPVLLRVHLNAQTFNDTWQIKATRVTETGEMIDMNGSVVKP